MKSLDVDIANVERRLVASGGTQGQDVVKSYLARRRQMETNYDQFISGLKLYDHPLTPQEQADSARDAPVRRMRDGRAAGVSGGSRQLHPQLAENRELRGGGEARAGNGLHQEASPRNSRSRTCRRSSSTWRWRKATSTRSPAVRRRGGAIAKGMWQFIPDTAKTLRPDGRAAGGVPTARPGRRSAQVGKGHAGGRGLHQGHLLDRRAGLGPAGDGVLQLGRAAGHQDAAHHAAESQGAQLLEGARAAPRAGAARRPTTTCMWIVSAAVIGENPKLFGFGFDSPLAATEVP